MSVSFAAIDLGTQSLRISVVNSHGEALWRWSHAVQSRINGPIYEQSPEEWATLLGEALGELGRTGLAPDALAVAAPLAGYIAVDSAGRALTPALMYPDHRTARHIEPVEQAVRTCSGSNPYGLRTTIADPLPHWLRLRDQPALCARTHRLLDATGWLNEYLTGISTINTYTALRLYNSEVRQQLQVPEALFGRTTAIGAVIGALRPALCDRFQLPAVPVISATFDSKCAYIGGGIHETGAGLDISGTVTSFGVVSASVLIDEKRRVYSVPFGRDKFLARGSNASSGGILEWARKELLADSFEAMDALVASTQPTTRSPIFLPYMAGERTPLWNPFATGAILGLSLDQSNRNHLARAIYEGIAFSLCHITETLSECGAKIGSIRLAGGLARSNTLAQIKSDVLGRELIRYSETELTTIGLCIIAGHALKVWRPDEDANAFFLKPDRIFTPDPQNHHIYEQNFRRYTQAITALLPTFKGTDETAA
ncbi:MAG: hypothetical protein EPN31_04775 [Castellaniella sp.]|uniref:xylulokinase n=1 Tax=Castellaniella sp. TaxID=1955812 RepID=UPI0011F9CD2B|nr:FGGY-family carbohydrate kinase [Castellaniella sp.]TAN30033.1 MAG: hypothetical protein EPN31_04775 [Castellaniella sp.]